MRIRGYDVVALAKKTWAEVGKDKVSVYAAQMAYSFFFALFPLLLFFAALLSLVADKQTVMAQFNNRIAAALPGDVASLLGKTVEKVIFSKGAPGLLSFGLLTTAWSGSGVFGALRAALNAAYDVQETRPWWKQYILQLSMLVVAGGVTVLATVILLNGEGVVGWLGEHLGLSRITTMIWTVVQFPLAVGALVAVLWMIYYFLPNCRHQDKRILIIAAMLSTLLWIAATLLFRVYVQKFNALNPAYGAIGAIMVLLTWMYYSSFVLLAVGELAAELEAGTGRVDQPVAAEGLSGAAVPRRYALVPTKGHGIPRMPRRPTGNGSHGRWGAFDWVIPSRAVRRTRQAVASAGIWVEDAADHLRTDIAVAVRELGGLSRSVGTGSMFCASAAAFGFLGALSLITGIILVIGDQWLPNDWYAIGAFLVAAAAALITGIFVRRGIRTLSNAQGPGTEGVVARAD
ncbi:MAG: YihY/virulence factor BrkB family protein [Gemmatimonadaceae bacterium]